MEQPAGSHPEVEDCVAAAGPAGAADLNASPTVAPPELSKNARKKQERLKRRAEKQAAKKVELKRAAAEASAVQLAERRARLAALSPEEQAELAQRRTAAVAERKQRAEADRARREQSLASPFSVVLDCAFAHLMTAKESKSLVAQFNHAYAANVRAAVPCRLCFTGLAGELAAGYDRHAGSDRWKVVRSDRSYLDVFAAQRDSLVYLTADSPNELAELREGDVYIVGGIVDRNRHKRLTLDKAEVEGIRHARLPIGAHLKMSGSVVLTVNQVLDILLAWLELRDWKLACERAVPMRKRGLQGNAPGQRLRREGGDEGEEEGEDEAEGEGPGDQGDAKLLAS